MTYCQDEEHCGTERESERCGSGWICSGLASYIPMYPVSKLGNFGKLTIANLLVATDCELHYRSKVWRHFEMSLFF